MLLSLVHTQCHHGSWGEDSKLARKRRQPSIGNNTSFVCLAPHPDDETLGCGGYLLRAKASGAKTYWVIITEVKDDDAQDLARGTAFGLARSC